MAKNFEDLDEQDFNTDEMRTVRYVQALEKKGVPEWEMENKIKPEHKWIVKPVIGRIRTPHATYLTSKKITSLAFLDQIKKPFFFLSVFLAVLLVGGYYINSLRSSTNVFQKQSPQQTERLNF